MTTKGKQDPKKSGVMRECLGEYLHDLATGASSLTGTQASTVPTLKVTLFAIYNLVIMLIVGTCFIYQVEYVTWNKMPYWLCEKCVVANVFTAEECSECGCKNGCVVDDPPTHLVERASRHWRKLKHFGRPGVDAGTPGYLRPKAVVSLFNSIPEQQRSECILLDLGCGPGHALCIAQELGFSKVAGIDIADCELVFKLNWQLYRADEANLYVQFGKDCVEEAWLPGHWQEPLIVYLFWATWPQATKANVISLLNGYAKKQRLRFVILVDWVIDAKGHKYTIPNLLDCGFFVYAYKTGLTLGGSGNSTFAGIVLSYGSQVPGSRLTVVYDPDNDEVHFQPTANA